VKARAKLGVGTFLLVLAACDTLSEPSDGEYTFIDDPDASNTSGKGGGAGVSTAGVAGTGGTGGTTTSPFCPEIDLDGDGAKVPGENCQTIPDFVLLGQADCDDLDPSVQLRAFIDADGDGAGDWSQAVCVPGPLPGFGYAPLGDDCDDRDPNIGPRMLDVSGDGIDRDCNGVDGAVDCSLLSTCPCNELMGDSVGLTGACSGFDLTVFDVIECSQGGCGGFQQYLRLANLGQAPSPGQVMLTGPDGVPHVLLDGLAAGSVTEPFAWPVASGAIRVSSSVTGDCDPSNDVYDPATRGGLDPLCPK
jgi:hypothetical protein